MKLERTKIELELYGEVFNLRKPTFKEAREYREELTKLGSESDATVVIESFLEKMGLPKEKFQDLEFDHVNEIMEFLLISKKK